jgi:hypothetical protein
LRRSLEFALPIPGCCVSSPAPGAFNQGLWYFASQIAASDVKLDDDTIAIRLGQGRAGRLLDADHPFVRR